MALEWFVYPVSQQRIDSNAAGTPIVAHHDHLLVIPINPIDFPTLTASAVCHPTSFYNFLFGHHFTNLRMSNHPVTRRPTYPQNTMRYENSLFFIERHILAMVVALWA
jgi:hypothetical protein